VILLIFQVKHYQIVKEIFLLYLLVIDLVYLSLIYLRLIPISKIRNVRFIVCNPPYIPTENYYLLDKETLHDPKISLDGGTKGLDFYIRIIDFLENLQYSGDIYFEIDPLIIEELDKFLLEKALKIVYKKQDYLKLDRLLKITFP